MSVPNVGHRIVDGDCCYLYIFGGFEQLLFLH